ncbi:MAG: phosphopantetheine-binding protein, partial [Bradymonadaceae bacterium]
MPEGRQRVRIVDPERRVPLDERSVGEIWVAGPSVADGYWRRPEESHEQFEATLRDGDGTPFLRTGDLGFRAGDDIVVTGRRDDPMIINGRNIYPQDVELSVAEAHEAIRAGGTAAFSVDRAGGEAPVVVAEVEEEISATPSADGGRPRESPPRASADTRPGIARATEAIRAGVTAEFRIEVADVVLIEPGSMPKTSSGKLQRNKCRSLYQADELDVVDGDTRDRDADTAVPTEPPVLSTEEWRKQKATDRRERVRTYLVDLLAFVLERSPDALQEGPLTSLGLDSQAAMELQRHIEQQLQTRVQ